METGRKLWEVPLGTSRQLFASKVKIPISFDWGTSNLGGPMMTASGLVFIAATQDRFLRAFDIETGRELWRALLPAGGKATPMTYRLGDGRQYVVIAAGGDGYSFGRSDAIVAFALPESR